MKLTPKGVGSGPFNILLLSFSRAFYNFCKHFKETCNSNLKKTIKKFILAGVKYIQIHLY